MSMINKVVWSPESPKAGQSVKIDVCGADGKPYDNKQATYVGINGVAGSSQYVQFAFAGDQKVVVSAIDTDGKTEQSTVTIPVFPPDLSEATQKRLADPANKDWSADQITWVKAVSDVRVLTSASAPPHDRPHRLVLRLVPLSTFVPPLAVKTAPLPPPTRPSPGAPPVSAPAEADTYVWDFGDGSPVAKTTSPAVTHDFSAALGEADEFRQFHVRVTAASGSANLGTWTRTVSVHNPYESCKKQGYLVLPVKAKGWAHKTAGHFVATAEITNPEPVTVTLGSRVVIPIAAEADETPAPGAPEKIDPLISVPGKGTLTVTVSAPFSVVSACRRGSSTPARATSSCARAWVAPRWWTASSRSSSPSRSTDTAGS